MLLIFHYRFTTYQDARRLTLVDGLEKIFETNILRVSLSPVKFFNKSMWETMCVNKFILLLFFSSPLAQAFNEKLNLTLHF